MSIHAEPVLHDTGDDAVARADRTSHGPADLRDADPRVVAHRHLDHPVSAHRAASHEFDRPSVGQLSQTEGTKHLIAGGTEWAEVGQGDSVKPPHQSRGEAVAEHGMPRHRAGREPTCEARSENDVRVTLPDRLDEPSQFSRSVAVVSIEEHHRVRAVGMREASQTGATIAAARLDDYPRAMRGCDLAGPVSRFRIDDHDLAHERVGNALEDIPDSLVSEIVVVDAESTDGTREIAAAHGARVIVEPRRGYGRACLTGLAHARSPDTVVFLDGDYSDRPGELGRLIEPIRQGRADVVLGSRLAGGLAPGAMPWHAVFGNRLAATLIRWLYGISLTDLGPFRAARYEVLRALDLREMTYGWAVELVTRGAMRGYCVMEVPVSYHPRIGVSKISGTVRGSIGAGYCILTGIVKNRLRVDRHPGARGPAT